MANKKRVSIINDQQQAEGQETIGTSNNEGQANPARHLEKGGAKIGPTSQLIQHSTAYKMSKFVNHKVA